MSEIDLWTKKVVEAGSKIRRLLATDSETYFQRAIRETFVAEPGLSDALDDAGVARLKADASAASAAAASKLAAALDDELWPSVSRPSSDSGEPAVGELAMVVSALDAFEAALSDFYGAQGLPGDPPGYALPARFIDGENLVSLTRSLWKAVDQLQAARAAVETTAAQSSAEQRRRRWEDA